MDKYLLLARAQNLSYIAKHCLFTTEAGMNYLNLLEKYFDKEGLKAEAREVSQHIFAIKDYNKARQRRRID